MTSSTLNRLTAGAALLGTGAALVALAVQAQTADPERGRLLYENHCAECHSTEVHFREQRKAASMADVRVWVAKWQAELELDWSGEEVEDVARHLNARFYEFPVE